MIAWSVKSVISDITGLAKSDVRLGHTLAGTYELSEHSRRELAGLLGQTFSDAGDDIPGGILPTETGAAHTVRDLVVLIRRKFGV